MSDEQATTEGASRRALLLGAGAVGATAFLTACGKDDDPGGTGTGSTGGATTGGGTQADGAIVNAADVKVGSGVILAAQGLVVTQPVIGTFKAFTNICTHQRCPLAAVNGGTINCDCHKSKFSIEDGSPKAGPALDVKDSSGQPKKLAETKVKRSGDSIVRA